MDLDIRTLIVMLALSSLGSAVVIFIIYKLHSEVPGILFWAFGGFIISGSLILLSLQGILPDFVTVVFANTAIIYGFGMTLSGMRVFLGRGSMLKTTLTAPLALVPLLSWYLVIQPSLAVRTIICSIAIAFFSGAIAYELLRETRGAGKPAQRLSGLIYAVNTALYLVRILLTLIQEPSGSFLVSGNAMVGLFFWLPVYIIGITAGMTLMISERLRAEIKTLGGLLPICSHCKKIRDDKGYWSQVESYIREYSMAEFTHGICPECADKYYPDMNLNEDD